MPNVSIQTLWRPKKGHTADEYEDAFAVTESRLPLRAAVADGATESAFSGGWARALAQGYVEHGALSEAIRRAGDSWSPPPDSRWYVAAKTAEGAHAAVLGYRLDEEGWNAESVGDCCLFQIRGGDVVTSWPFDDAAAFTHRPALVSSRDVLPDIASTSGGWRSGDTFVLATDALAAWLLEQETVPEDLDAAVAGAAGMRNDDVTAVSITVHE